MNRLRRCKGGLPPLPRTIQNPPLRIRQQDFRLPLVRLKHQPLPGKLQGIHSVLFLRTRCPVSAGFITVKCLIHALSLPRAGSKQARACAAFSSIALKRNPLTDISFKWERFSWGETPVPQPTPPSASSGLLIPTVAPAISSPVNRSPRQRPALARDRHRSWRAMSPKPTWGRRQCVFTTPGYLFRAESRSRRLSISMRSSIKVRPNTEVCGLEAHKFDTQFQEPAFSPSFTRNDLLADRTPNVPVTRSCRRPPHRRSGSCGHRVQEPDVLRRARPDRVLRQSVARPVGDLNSKP
jgi:hypothetical protein